MSGQINPAGNARVVVLDSEMGIQQAADFHAAVLTLAGQGGAVRLDAGAVRCVHSSILQILHALAQAVPDFGVIAASPEFRAAEGRIGLAFPRRPATGAATIPDKPAEEIYA